MNNDVPQEWYDGAFWSLVYEVFTYTERESWRQLAWAADYALDPED